MTQTIDTEGITKATALKINGAVSANTVFYSSNAPNSSREPMSYLLQGSINVNWLTLSVPVSYSLTSQGSDLGYQLPFDFNRLSLHPKYKWIQAHIGDVSMTFSPYTLSGYQFTGGGIELTPKGPFHISLMGGRLSKAVEEDDNIQTLAVFRRMGYGAKLDWNKQSYKIGVIGFYAKDDLNSIAALSEGSTVTPKENLAISISGETELSSYVTLRLTYASTALTEDIRSSASGVKKGLASLFFKNKQSTSYYDAIKTGVDFHPAWIRLGIAYERVAPGYETLGAYYFNEDLENITVNGARPFFNNRLNLSFTVGLQKDNVSNQKDQQKKRTALSLSAELKPTDKVTIIGSYSNMSTHTNKKLNQFDVINDNDLTDDAIEALDYKQLSRNMSVNTNFILGRNDKINQSLSLTYSLASSANEENGIIRIGSANNFHNASVAHTLGFPKIKLNVNSSLLYSYSDAKENNSRTWGPLINVGKSFFKDKLSTLFGLSYNTSIEKTSTTNILNIRLNASTAIAKKHNFNLSVVQIFRNAGNTDGLSEFTFTFGYNYGFDLIKSR